MKGTLCGIALAVVVGCSAHHGASPSAAAGQGEGSSRSGALPASELSPEQIRLVQRALADRGYAYVKVKSDAAVDVVRHEADVGHRDQPNVPARPVDAPIPHNAFVGSRAETPVK